MAEGVLAYRFAGVIAGFFVVPTLGGPFGVSCAVVVSAVDVFEFALWDGGVTG